MRTVRQQIGVILGWMVLVSASPVNGQDWPQWRGPNRDGKVTGFIAPQTWPKELTRKWSVSVGDGVATQPFGAVRGEHARLLEELPEPGDPEGLPFPRVLRGVAIGSLGDDAAREGVETSEEARRGSAPHPEKAERRARDVGHDAGGGARGGGLHP